MHKRIGVPYDDHEVAFMVESTKVGIGVPVFSLAENQESVPVTLPWVGDYLALGARLARQTARPKATQLVITLSVPQRDYVAALIGAGWVLTRPPQPGAGSPLEIARELGLTAWYRAVNATYIYDGELHKLDEVVQPARMRYADSQFLVRSFLKMAPSAPLEGARRQERRKLGSVARFTRADQDWEERLVAPTQDLALVGIESRLRADLEAVICRVGAEDGDRLDGLLMPWTRNAATWFSKIYSSATLEEAPNGYNAIVLDGQGAIAFIGETYAPIVICILDRSVADETQAQNLANMRRTEGTAVDVPKLLGWSPPVGIEVMGFEVRL